MQNDKLFIGNIMQCTKHDTHTTFSSEMFIGDQSLGVDSFGYIDSESEVLKENATLIKTKHGYYVDIEGLSLTDIAYLYLEGSKAKVRGTKSGKLFMLTSGSYKGDLFVDRESIKPYVSEDKNKNSSSIIGIQREIKGKAR